MPQNQLDTDSFGGTNGNGLHLYNANWVRLDTTNGNEALVEGTPGVGQSATSGANIRNGQTWTTDHWAELKIDSTTLASDKFCVGVRCTQGSGDTCTGYWGGIDRNQTGGTYQIYKFSSTSAITTLATASSLTYALGDVVNLQIVGNILTLTVNGVAVPGLTAVSDSTYGTGSPALFVGDSHTSIRLGGTWRAGSVGSAGSPDTLWAQSVL